MPELPEVETVRRGLALHLLGRRFAGVRVRDGRLRWPVDAAKLGRVLPGRSILALRRRAKYILVDLAGGWILMFHLGMTGRLTLAPSGAGIARHDHLLFDLGAGQQLRFNDARRFGSVELFATDAEPNHPRLARLGLEPLGKEFTARALFAMSRGVTKSAKALLMDNSRIVGIGNIYACESLFRAGIHPVREAGGLSQARCQRLCAAIRRILRAAIKQGGTTVRNFANADGDPGTFAVRLRVYGREGKPCPCCGRGIRRIVQAGRSTFHCTRCQR